jgi:hypothetical protein
MTNYHFTLPIFRRHHRSLKVFLPPQPNKFHRRDHARRIILSSGASIGRIKFRRTVPVRMACEIQSMRTQ